MQAGTLSRPAHRMDFVLIWLNDNQLFLGAIAGLSTAFLLLTILATPWLVARLPSDYFMTKDIPRHRSAIMHILLIGVRGLLGVILVLLGILMLVVPGPGLVTLLVGVSLAEFPGKHRLLRYIATRPSVFWSLNWMRRRYGKQPFDHP